MVIDVSGAFIERISVLFPDGISVRQFTFPSQFLAQGGTVTATVHHCTVEDANGKFTGWADEKTQQINIHSPQVTLTLPKTELTGSAIRFEPPGTISQEDEIVPDITSLESSFGYRVTVTSFDPDNPAPLRFPFDSFDGGIFWLAQTAYTIKSVNHDGPFTIRGNDVTRTTTAFVTVKYSTTSGIDLSPYAATFTIKVKPREQRKLSAQILGTTNPSEEQEISPDVTKVINIPLGGEFILQLLNTDGSPVSSSVLLVASDVISQELLSQSSLFPSSVIVPIGTGDGSGVSHFIAVHLGKVLIEFTPAGSTEALKVEIDVYFPALLNGTDHDRDTVILELAHRHGILPQYYKAQFAKEGQNKATAWRYEPLNTDLGDLGISRGMNLRAKAPYSLYRLQTVGDQLNPGTCQKYPDADLRIPDQTCPGLGSGNLATDADLEPAVNAALHIRIPIRDPKTGEILLDANKAPLTRTLQLSDRFSYISARDIFDFNDGGNNGTGYHWARHVPKARLATRIASLTFTAQPTLASSYGLMQVMYAKAIKVGWNPPDGRNPSLLLDTPDNLAKGGGSLEPGSKILEEFFYGNYKELALHPFFESKADFESKFEFTYQKYDPGVPGYGQDVIGNLSHGFLPIPDKPLFGGGE